MLELPVPVLADPPASLCDVEQQPEPNWCECGAPLAWKWYEPPRATRASHWKRQHGPCASCKQQDEDSDAAYRLATLQGNAGIPQKLRPYVLERYLAQRANEVADELQRRVARQDIKHVGVYLANADVYASLRQWRPKRGQSFLLHGPVGTGKSLLCAAWANSRLIGEDNQVVTDAKMLAKVERLGPEAKAYALSRGLHQRHSGERVYPVLYVTEPELLAEEKAHWRGNPDPLLRLSKAAVLILDELGSAPANDWAVACIEKLVCFRYDRGLPMFITTNMAPVGGKWSQPIQAHYGHRVADRLREMVASRAYPVFGPGWRTEVARC